MRASRCVIVLALLAVTTSLATGPVHAQQSTQPKTEAQIVRMIELKVKGEVIASLIQKQGIDFTVDDPAIERLKKAGAGDVVLAAGRQAGATKPAAATADNTPVTFQDVVELLKLGVPESEILDRLKQSPTTFTLDQGQVAELKRLGASEALLNEMKAVKPQVGAAGELSNLAIVLDCSGSMSELTPEGRSKMDAARQAAVKLVQEVPEGVRVSFVIYGHDRAQECNAVRVVRPLVPLD